MRVINGKVIDKRMLRLSIREHTSVCFSSLLLFIWNVYRFDIVAGLVGLEYRLQYNI